MRAKNIVKTLGLCSIAMAVGLLALAGQEARTATAGNGYFFSGKAPFSWVDACAEGNVLADISDEDDEYQSEVAIGFPFTFFGTDYDNVEPTSNGVISFDEEGNSEYDNEAIPTTEWEFAALFPWWDDLDTEVAGQVCAATVGDAPNRAFVVEWDAVGDHNIGVAEETISFEAVMCEATDNVVFQYLDAVFGDEKYPDKDNAGEASVGIQESSANGLQYSFDEALIQDGQAIVFYPSSGSDSNCVAAEEPPTVEPTPTTGPGETPQPPSATGGVSVSVSDDAPAPGDTVTVTATATDAGGNPVAGAECTFRIYSQPGDDASVDEGPVTTDANGQATTTLNVGSTVGTVEVLATCGVFNEVLAVEVGVGLPSTGGAIGSSDASTWLLLAAGLAAFGLGALALRDRTASKTH
jgi:hypothetical protein